MTHPIYLLLSARLACIEAGVDAGWIWFYRDRTPEADAIVRQWAADHADVVKAEDRKVGLVVTHRRTYYGIATVYPTHGDDWRPSDGVQP